MRRLPRFRPCDPDAAGALSARKVTARDRERPFCGSAPLKPRDMGEMISPTDGAKSAGTERPQLNAAVNALPVS